MEKKKKVKDDEQTASSKMKRKPVKDEPAVQVIQNELWVKQGDSYTRKLSEPQKKYGQFNWKTNGLQRVLYSTTTTFQKKKTKSGHTLLCAYFESEDGVHFEEKQVFLKKSVVKAILNQLDPEKQGFQPLDVGEPWPTLFWHLVYYYKSIERGLTRTGHHVKPKVVTTSDGKQVAVRASKRQKREVQKFEFDPDHKCNDDRGKGTTLEELEMSTGSDEVSFVGHQEEDDDYQP